MHGKRVPSTPGCVLFQAEGARLAFAGYMIQDFAHHQASQGLARGHATRTHAHIGLLGITWALDPILLASHQRDAHLSVQ